MILHRLFPALSLISTVLCVPLDTSAQNPLLHEHKQDPTQGGLESTRRIPTRYESTVLARRLLALSSFGVVSTTFPPDDDADDQTAGNSGSALKTTTTTTMSSSKFPALEHWSPNPGSVSSLPIALPEYLSDCDQPSRGNPTLLLLDPSTVSRNLAAQPPGHQNLSLSLSWWEDLQQQKQQEKKEQQEQQSAQTQTQTQTQTHSSPKSSSPPPYYTDSPASLPRLSLLGYPEEIPTTEAEDSGIASCYLNAHPDARWWLPGDKHAAHGGRWVRMVVTHVYWLGGFGDRAYLGWLDVQEWKRVREAEWKGVRLPGEEGGMK